MKKKLWLNGKIYTVDEKLKWAEAIVTEGNKIVFVGSNKEAKSFAGNEYEEYDFQNKLVLPGFIDSHVHFMIGGLSLRKLDLGNVKSKEQFRKEVEDVGCWIVDNHCIRTIHAEMNAILQCSIHGVSTQGATAYVTNMPCTNCAKALVGAGIKEVVIFSDYHDTQAEEFFKIGKVKLRRLKMPDTEIDYDLGSFSSAKKTKKSK